MDPAILGEYALKTALQVALKTAKQVALNIKKLYTSEVDDGITAAFEFALNDWSKHAPTTSDKVRLSKALEEYIQSSISYEALDPDTRAFIDYFKKRLSEQPAAHNYLMTLRSDMQAISEEQNLLEHYKTQELVRGLIAQMKGFNMDPEDIQVLLEELPLKRGLECTKLALEEMLEKRRIPSEEVKQLFLEFVRFHLEEIAKRGEEAKQLRVAGDSYLAENLEEINRVLTGESEQSLTAVHKKCQEQAKQNEIRLLEELIEAALIKFSFGEVRDFYERLIELAPTMDHHFKYACLLQDLNDFDKARSHYEEVLQELRQLSRQNPKAYKPYVAIALNNLGSLFSDINDLNQAQAYYEEALKLCRELSEQNPKAYKPYVAIALNNLGSLFSDINDLNQAQAYYEEALKLCRELSEQNPEANKPYLALALNNLGCLHQKTNELQQARTYYEEALEIRRELSEQNPEAYKPAVARSLNNLGILLKDTNELEKARTCYKEALAIRRELSEQNPEAYMPDVAESLNDLGLLLQDTNELQQAQAYYEEALQIRRNLADQNPEAYNTKVATTLYNLVSLYVGLKKIEDAEKAYQEAHDIYQELANHHPRAYEIDYAEILGIGFDLLGKPKEDLEKAKAILDKYPEHPQAQELLSRIEKLGKR